MHQFYSRMLFTSHRFGGGKGKTRSWKTDPKYSLYEYASYTPWLLVRLNSNYEQLARSCSDYRSTYVESTLHVISKGLLSVDKRWFSFFEIRLQQNSCIFGILTAVTLHSLHCSFECVVPVRETFTLVMKCADSSLWKNDILFSKNQQKLR